MEEIIKLIKEYGELENSLGYFKAVNNEINKGVVEISNKRTEVLQEIMSEIIKVNERLLNDGK